jgi:hypothetical protein
VFGLRWIGCTVILMLLSMGVGEWEYKDRIASMLVSIFGAS